MEQQVIYKNNVKIFTLTNQLNPSLRRLRRRQSVQLDQSRRHS